MTTDHLRRRSTARQWVANRKGREMRQTCFLTAQEVADELGVNVNTVLTWERGTSQPRAKVAERWVELLEETQRQIAA